MFMVQISLQRLGDNDDLALPHYATAQAAGADLLAAVKEAITLAPGKRALIPTGIAIALPANYEAQVRPRSGLAFKSGVTVLNSPGTIDADYRGEIGVILINHGDADFVVERGMRIAQLIIAPVQQGQWQVVDNLETTTRGAGGFGSTGVASTATNSKAA